MGEDRSRAHVVIPSELLREIDNLVGNRRRSDFFVEAVKEKIERTKLRQAAHAFAGSFRDIDIPHWETPEATSAWVRALRRESDENAFSGDETV